MSIKDIGFLPTNGLQYVFFKTLNEVISVSEYVNIIKLQFSISTDLKL